MAFYLRLSLWAKLMCLYFAIQDGANAGSTKNLRELSAVDAIDLLCQREVSAVEYASALISRAEELACLNVYATINATQMFLTTEHGQVLAEAAEVDKKAEDGGDIKPLCGFAMAVKDNIDVAGYPTEAGTPALKGMVQLKDAPLIQQLRAAHGVILGKTRMHELAEGYTSISSFYGPVLNPYQIDTHVGGSSGGTAALVAAQGAAIGFCSDTGGSCRVPASLTGTVGYRPTSIGSHGQQCYKTSSGIFPMTTSRDTAGLIARTVADVKLLDSIFSNCSRNIPEIELEGYRIGVAREWFNDTGDETHKAFEAAFESMRKAGVELVEFDVGLMLMEQIKNAPEFFTYDYEMPREIARYLWQHKYNLTLTDLIERLDSPLCKASMEKWAYRDLEDWPNPQQYLHMLGTVTPKITQLWVDYFDNLDFHVMLAPTTAITTRPIGDDGVLLAVGEALEKVVAKTPPPPSKPACTGCTAKVTLRPEKAVPPDSEFRYSSAEEAKQAARELSMYDFHLEGSCDFLEHTTPSVKTEL